MLRSAKLIDGKKRAKAYPSAFFVPDAEDIATVRAGDYLYVGLEAPSKMAERFWVEVTQIGKDYFKGTIANQLCDYWGLAYGDEIKFQARHILNIRTIGQEFGNYIVKLTEQYNPLQPTLVWQDEQKGFQSELATTEMLKEPMDAATEKRTSRLVFIMEAPNSVATGAGVSRPGMIWWIDAQHKLSRQTQFCLPVNEQKLHIDGVGFPTQDAQGCSLTTLPKISLTRRTASSKTAQDSSKEGISAKESNE